MENMTTENAALILRITITNEKPIELIEYTRSLISIANEFNAFCKANNTGLDENVRLYIKEVRSGSIISDLMAVAALVACGDSMSPEINDGDKIVCDPSLPPVSGDIVYYRIRNESAVKVLVEYKESNILQFRPYNPNQEFQTRIIRLDDDEAQDLIMHKVVLILKDVRNNRLTRLKMVGW